MNNFENNKDIQWNNSEKKNSNWFKEKWESLKSFLEWKKNDVIWNSSEKSKWLKDLVVDSSLLDLEKWSKLSDSEVETKGELAKLQKNEKVVNQQELSQQIMQNSEKYKWRSSGAVQWIENAAMTVEDDIKNWNQEENSIARTLLQAANSIMDTENKA